jgi:fimbrial isopeptide formation D2 family protein
MTDTLVPGVTFAGNVTLNGSPLSSPGGYTFTGGVLRVPLGDIQGTTRKTVTFDVTINADAYGADIKNTVAVKGKDGTGGDDLDKEDSNDGDDTVVTPRSAQPTIDPVTVGDSTISGTGVNGAAVRVTLPDGTVLPPATVAGGTWTVNVPADKTLPAGQRVTAVQTEPNKDPSAPREATVAARPDPVKEMTKTSENKTRAEGRQVNDILEFTITVKNTGSAKSLWENVVVNDTIPAGLTFSGLSTVTIDGVAAGAAASWNGSLLRVNLGNIPGNTTKVIVFRAVINESAAGTYVRNSARVDDLEVTEPPVPIVRGRSPKPTIDEVNEGDRVISGTGDTTGQRSIITVSYPNSALTTTAQVQPNGTWTVTVPNGINLNIGDVVSAVQTVTDNLGIEQWPSEPATATVDGKKPVIPYMRKTVLNQTSSDNKTRVGDSLLYTVTIENRGSSKSYWTNAVMTDVIPDGLTLDEGSILLNGSSPTYSSYTRATKTLKVTIWSQTITSGIQGGTRVVVTFTVTVDADAYGKTIRNAASVAGTENGGDNPISYETQEPGGNNIVPRSSQPEVDPVVRDDTKVTGKGVPGATIVVTLPDGGQPIPAVTVDGQGNWEVRIPAGREPDTGDEIKVVQTENEKDPSAPVIRIVIDKDYRAVHGFVWPMASVELRPGFLEKHEIVVELRTAFRTPAASNLTTRAVLINSTGDGEFTIGNVPFGTYILYIKRPGYLVRCMMVTVTASSPDMIQLVPPNTNGDNGVFNLLWGDCNGDYAVDNLDMMMVLGQMETDISANDTAYIAACDMNADGRPDNSDIMMVLGSWGRNIREYAGGENVTYN